MKVNFTMGYFYIKSQAPISSARQRWETAALFCLNRENLSFNCPSFSLYWFGKFPRISNSLFNFGKNVRTSWYTWFTEKIEEENKEIFVE